MQRYVNEVRNDIQREIELDELRKLKQSVEDSARSIEDSVHKDLDAARDEVRALESLAETANPHPGPAAEAQPPGTPEPPAPPKSA